MVNPLKRIELNGFKSFAQKTMLEFPTGITAIVGPNGSGKSNIIDAVRWLLGEREARNLRGAKVEDLIFAGTPKKARLGQAQASLHFDNRKRRFPVDFEEIAISRQVNRSGISRYYLNKSEIRLKDAVDFFAKARLGIKGLIVVTQGNSDVFVRTTPAGRREMIEEMLGLREYQLKKFDAERRLKNAEINLEKAKALMEEIVPHLRSLRRQTGRWERRETTEKELHELEMHFFGFQIHRLKREIRAVEAEMKAHSDERKNLDEERKKAEAHVQEVESNQPKERQQLIALKNQIRELLEKKSALQKEIGKAEAQLEIAKTSHAHAVPVEIPTLIKLLGKIKKTLGESLEKDIAVMRSDIQAVLKEIDETLHESSEHHDAAAEKIKSQFEKIHKDLAGLENEIHILKESEKQLEKNQEQFYRSFKEAIERVEKIKDRIERWEVQNQQRMFKKERLEIRFQELERQIHQAGRQAAEFESYQSEKDVREEELLKTEKQILRLRGILASIGDIDEALVKEAKETEERYRFLSQQSKDLEKACGDLKRLISDLSEKIRTEFSGALTRINEEFNKFFRLMFGGGRARLKVRLQATRAPRSSDGNDAHTEEEKETSAAKEDDEEEEGIDVDLNLPRKKITSLEMLSGGEKSLVGIAALFALISVSPPPFLILDEIDAALDDRNARRFSEMIREFSKEIQFIIVTHNRATMEVADVLYGITMDDDGTSKILSLKLET